MPAALDSPCDDRARVCEEFVLAGALPAPWGVDVQLGHSERYARMSSARINRFFDRDYPEDEGRGTRESTCATF